MISQIIITGIGAAVSVTLAPEAMDAFNSAFAAQTRNVVISDAYTLAKASTEEALLSDSGSDYPATLTRNGNRIAELPQVRLGNVTTAIRYFNEADRVWVETCGTDAEEGRFCAQFDTETGTLTVFKNGTVVETR